ncbi:MAG TPA: sodium/proline symporter [Steroidobacteraceae bacterium]|nr:sodium/proline symporter [Steroidobacteraceae bacterium]
MEPRGWAIVTIAGYGLLMLVIGAWANRRTRDAADFFLSGRRLGPWVAALAQGATQSSAWTLAGVSGAAFLWGRSAAWIWLSVVSGYAVNWLWIAPRLRRLSAADGSLSLVQLLFGGAARRPHRRMAAVIILLSFLFYVAAQFEAAGQAFAVTLGLPVAACIATGAAITVAYTLAGGFWAASVTDFVQGALMLVIAVVLPAAGVAAVGGFEAVLAAADAPSPSAPAAAGGIAFIAGVFGIGLGAFGQPHVANHFMAARDEAAIRQGGIIAIAWIALILAGMLVAGWAGRALAVPPANGETVLYVAAQAWLPPVFAGIVAVAVMSAIMSTVDSQLITATSSITVDVDKRSSLPRTRAALLGFSLAATALAIFAPEAIYSRVLFAWNALGAAFGPLVVLAVLGRRPAPPAGLAGMLTGFGLTIAFYLLPDAPGDVLERIVPFFVALAIVLLLDRRRQPAVDGR